MKTIKKMPSKKLLEDYLNSEDGVKVYFDITKGLFVRTNETIDNNPLKK